ncbi:beta-1,3-galactosyltransferase 2-like [Oryzias melastigma]|uniref:Hexosyltransferase n=1 Tax=Oryzias melastigma TaxID=30732 RepID=A0A3B3BYN2_ORYME|nr:beta-1,3-galactosyltransferase 2-like [Oryzias melastigma]
MPSMDPHFSSATSEKRKKLTNPLTLKRTSVKAAQSEEMLNGSRALHSRRCWCFLQRHYFLCILLTGAVFFMCNTSMKTVMPDLNAKLWMENLSKKLMAPIEKLDLVSDEAGRTAVAVHQFDDWMSLMSVPPTAGKTREPRAKLHTQASGPNQAPNKFPAPYLVKYPSEYHFVINEPLKCEKEKPFVVLIVQVAPHNRAHRHIIRSTWGSQSRVFGRTVLLFFLLGQEKTGEAPQLHRQLLRESRQHRDLIQSDFVDCYRNLTIKTMVMLEWLDSYCSSASYAMKIDSDMFLNVRNLVIMLLKAPKTNYMTGRVDYRATVQRDPSSKWYLPQDLYPRPTYPPYALGLGYILSLDLPKKLIVASRHVKAIYIEDVYLGLCMEHLQIHPKPPRNRDHFHLYPMNYSRCTFSEIIVTATTPETDPLKLWRDFIAPGPDC